MGARLALVESDYPGWEITYTYDGPEWKAVLRRRVTEQMRNLGIVEEIIEADPIDLVAALASQVRRLALVRT
ncbi:hypothetical protein [Nonomuraea maheshkhaliensis]|uniref:hypothetical protein n=1 Tax=Nonomuraea maheshkhaliensis TaxID=419590 RepID=UPI0031F914BB